jgi:hypothetical protein
MKSKAITPQHKNKRIINVVRSLSKKVRKTLKEKDEFDRFDEFLEKFTNELKKSGFEHINGGSFKEVFHNPKYEEFVVKVYTTSNGPYDDTNLSKLPKSLKKYFLYPVAKTGTYIIQPKANGKRKDRRPAYKCLYKLLGTERLVDLARDRDIMGDNVKFHDGNPVIVDFC